MTDSPGELLRQIPQVERVLQLPEIEALREEYARAELVEAVRQVLAGLRRDILAGQGLAEDRLRPEALADHVLATLEQLRLSAHRRAINGTGVVLHTGLGRAVLPPSALRSAMENAAGYCLLEVDVESGERGRRDAAVAKLLRELTGAEDATVVNNNAAATLLILAALARKKEVIISRGQLVEIGGSFRIPDILEESGCHLVEVGTTNRTYVDDYRRAVGPDTGLLLQVHTSNYEIAGFASHTPLEELVALGEEVQVPVVSDLGSGCFIDLSPYGFRPEPLAKDSIRAGADLVCFSGDKLLGGPQAGIVVGKREFIDRVRSHPLYRPLRVDKLTLLLLEGTLRAYNDPEELGSRLPVLHAITAPLEIVRLRATSCAERIRIRAPWLVVDVVDSGAQAGSGALPAQEIPSAALAIQHPHRTSEDLSRTLRLGNPPVFTRIQNAAVLIDFRTVMEGEEPDLVEAVSRLA